MANLFPIVLILLMGGAGVVDLIHGLTWRAVYYLSGALLNVAVVMMGK